MAQSSVAHMQTVLCLHVAHQTEPSLNSRQTIVNHHQQSKIFGAAACCSCTCLIANTQPIIAIHEPEFSMCSHNLDFMEKSRNAPLNETARIEQTRGRLSALQGIERRPPPPYGSPPPLPLFNRVCLPEAPHRLFACQSFSLSVRTTMCSMLSAHLGVAWSAFLDGLVKQVQALRLISVPP